MAKQRFRLETLLRLRALSREERQRALAEAYQAETRLEQQRLQLDAELANVRNDYREASRQGEMDVDRLMAAQRYELTLQAQVRQIAEQQQMLAEETERRREALVEADRQVKVLERLREVHLQRHRDADRKAEEKFLDEVAARTVREARQT
jgi:flagellar export protein FliJ